MDGAGRGAVNHAGAAGPCGRRPEKTGSMSEARPEPARQNDAAPRATGPAPPAAEAAGRNGTKTSTVGMPPLPRLVSGVADKAGNLERKSRELSKTPENRVTPAVQNLVSQVGRPYVPSGFPPGAGMHTGTETDALLRVLVRLAPRRGSRGLQGKWPLLVRAGGKLVAACGPPSTRNSLSVQEARRCAAARHSAFSSTATGHPPGQGPGR